MHWVNIHVLPSSQLSRCLPHRSAGEVIRNQLQVGRKREEEEEENVGGRGVEEEPHLALAALHDDQLLLRGGPGKHDLGVILEDVVQLLGAQVLEVAAVHHAGLGVPGGGDGQSVSQSARQPDSQTAKQPNRQSNSQTAIQPDSQSARRETAAASRRARLRGHYLGLTSLMGMLRRAAMSSMVSLPSEMMPTPLAMALAVIGWSPVTMMTYVKR